MSQPLSGAERTRWVKAAVPHQGAVSPRTGSREQAATTDRDPGGGVGASDRRSCFHRASVRRPARGEADVGPSQTLVPVGSEAVSAPRVRPLEYRLA